MNFANLGERFLICKEFIEKNEIIIDNKLLFNSLEPVVFYIRNQ
jgi:hypothetical protein